MADEPVRPGSARTSTTKSRRGRRRELQLADGGRLVLNADRSIDRVDDDGNAVQSWTPDDPEWARSAIRFGLHPQESTVAPRGRDVGAMKPPHR